jgi:hypothetical protein
MKRTQCINLSWSSRQLHVLFQATYPVAQPSLAAVRISPPNILTAKSLTANRSELLAVNTQPGISDFMDTVMFLLTFPSSVVTGYVCPRAVWWALLAVIKVYTERRKQQTSPYIPYSFLNAQQIFAGRPHVARTLYCAAASTLVNHVTRKKNTRYVGLLSVPLIVTFSWAAHKPAHNNWSGVLP